MAYLKEIWTKCGYNSACTRRAVIQLCGRRNDLHGQYCRRHGNEELKRLKAIEAENDADTSAPREVLA